MLRFFNVSNEQLEKARQLAKSVKGKYKDQGVFFESMCHTDVFYIMELGKINEKIIRLDESENSYDKYKKLIKDYDDAEKNLLNSILDISFYETFDDNKKNIEFNKKDLEKRKERLEIQAWDYFVKMLNNQKYCYLPEKYSITNYIEDIDQFKFLQEIRFSDENMINNKNKVLEAVDNYAFRRVRERVVNYLEYHYYDEEDELKDYKYYTLDCFKIFDNDSYFNNKKVYNRGKFKDLLTSLAILEARANNVSYNKDKDSIDKMEEEFSDILLSNKKSKTFDICGNKVKLFKTKPTSIQFSKDIVVLLNKYYHA